MSKDSQKPQDGKAEGASSGKHGMRPIIIVKKIKKGHAGHHGGQWKVAYADFVTAMMAFFMLMWLLNVVSEDTLKGVAEYFTPSVGLKGQNGVGLDGGLDSSKKDGMQANNSASDMIYGVPQSGPTLVQDSAMSVTDDGEKQKFVSIMNNIDQKVDGAEDLKQFSDNLMVDITSDGLRIQIIDSVNRPIFKPGTEELQPFVLKILNVVGGMLNMVPNYLSITGHTSYGDRAASDKWQLSVDRANKIREAFLTNHLIKDDQVVRIIGKADREPFDEKDYKNPKNSRVEIILLNNSSVSKFQKSTPDT